MTKSHLEKNVVAIISACFHSVEKGNQDMFEKEEAKQNFRNIRKTIISLMVDILYPKNNGVGLTPSQSFGYVDKSFEQFQSLAFRQGQDIKKIFDKVSIIASDADQAIEYGLISAMTDAQFDQLFSRLQKELGTQLNAETFSLKLELERQGVEDRAAQAGSRGRRFFGLRR